MHIGLGQSSSIELQFGVGREEGREEEYEEEGYEEEGYEDPAEYEGEGEVEGAGAELKEIGTAEPTWNVWVEPRTFKGRYSPSSPLVVGRRYRLAVDLAMLAYGESAGVYSREGQESLRKWLDDIEWDEAQLRVLALADSSHLTIPSSERVQEMDVNVERFKNSLGKTVKVGDSPLETLRGRRDAPFRLGSVVFPLNVRSEGLGSIALSIWADRRPVDELTLNLCVVKKNGDPCPLAAARPVIGLEGVTSLRADPVATPDLALHVLELGEDDVVGVLHCTACGWAESRFETWDVGASVDGLERHLAETLVPELQEIRDIRSEEVRERQFQILGRALVGMLFGNPADVVAAKAERTFFNATRELRARHSSDGPAALPSLFVRMVPRSRVASFLAFPLGLGYVPPDNAGGGFFLGEAFDVETALPHYDYSDPPGGCVSDWIVLVPPLAALIPGNASHKPLIEAVEPISALIERFKVLAEEAEDGSSLMFGTPTELASWFGKQVPTPDRPKALLTISHHDRNALYFTEQRAEGALVSSGIRRAIGRPSVAIVLGCGTGSAGASEIVRMLNLAGAATVVATSTEVDGKVAGELISEVFQRLSEHRDDEAFGIGQALADSSRKLMPKYGAQVLSFVLAGNGGLRVCPPRGTDDAPEGAEGGVQ